MLEVPKLDTNSQFRQPELSPEETNNPEARALGLLARVETLREVVAEETSRVGTDFTDEAIELRNQLLDAASHLGGMIDFTIYQAETLNYRS